MPIPSLSRRLRTGLRWCRNGALCGSVVYLAAGFLSLRLVREPETVLEASLAPLTLLPYAAAHDAEDEGGIPTAEGTVVRGVLSVHTGRSHDAEGSLEQVALAARRTGLDFVVLGDHPGDWMEEGPNVMEPRHEEGVLLVPGLELVVSGVGRTLAVGLDTLPARWEGSVESLSARADSLGGFLSVVHPRSPRSRERWNGLAAPGVHAWESFDISEMARLRLKDPWAAYHVASFLGSLAVGRGDASLRGLWRERTATPALLSYDSARASRPLALTGGLNHHPKARWGDALFPAYEPFFRTVVNHVLLGPEGLDPDPVTARGQILAALKAGRVYVTLGNPAGAEGFHLDGVKAEGPPLEMGDRAPWTPGAELRLQLPRGGGRGLLVRILRDGREAAWVRAAAGEELRWSTREPGVYRVEVFQAGLRLGAMRLGFRPWILSNPVEFYRDPPPAEGTGSNP
ncbi:MAG TPA: hypothetical protein VLA43_20955 [Longimicrobiales bacterium]|nr:hypothetical protein [Longimicrobiales bacterium]